MAVPARPALFHASARVRVTALRGSGPRLVVCFSGPGDPDRAHQSEEFEEICAMEARNHVLFVSDTQRSWFNAPGIYEEILDLVESYRRMHQIDEVVTLGESMGGYGAIVFADPFGARTCVALSPQYSADPAVVPEEDRWREERSRIALFTRPPLEATLSATCQYFVMHGAVERERPHWGRFPRAENFNHYLTGHSEGALSEKMRAAGKLHAILTCAMQGRPVAFRRALHEMFNTLRRVEKV